MTLCRQVAAREPQAMLQALRTAVGPQVSLTADPANTERLA